MKTMETVPHADASQLDATGVNRAAAPVVYFDARFSLKDDVRISPDDRGFLLGDGVYEVAAAYDGNFVALDRHLERLSRSLAESRIDDSVTEPLETVFQELLERNGLAAKGKALVYLQITRGVAPRTHAFPKTPVRPTVYAFAAPFPDMGDLDAGVSAITRPDRRWSRCDIKSISLMANCLANQEAKESGAFEAILIRDGIALEGTHTSFFAVLDDRVVTAPLSPLILPGITREIVLELCRSHDIAMSEEPIPETSLGDATELFITGTTTEVVPIIAVDGRPIGNGKPGPVTSRLISLYRSSLGLDG
jgi:D-alanine transaminase